MREIYKLHYKLEEKVIHDPLTNLYNRSTLKIYLQQAIAQSKRSMMPMTLISLDIDHFKKINDRFGHDKGDEVLVNLSELLQNRIRESDRVFRMGGEEFLICLYNTEQSSSVKFAEALRKQVEQTLQLPEHPITISLGVADLEKDMDLHSWLKACDNNLYKAKHEGRNCVVA